MHSHSHSHQHGTDDRIGWAFFLNVTFTIIEFIGGWLTNSTAIMADAVHDLGDSLSIGFAWILSRFSNKAAPDKYSYGYRRLTLFGALVNGVVLVIGSIWVLFEAIPRLTNPEMPVVEGMLGLAILGVAVNGYAVFKLKAVKWSNRSGHINSRHFYVIQLRCSHEPKEKLSPVQQGVQGRSSFVSDRTRIQCG